MSQQPTTGTELLKSAYEIARDKQIKENLQVLISMGLATSATQQDSSLPRTTSSQPTNKRRRLAANPPVRFSKRIRKQAPEIIPFGKEESKPKEEDGEEWTYRERNKAIELKLKRLVEAHKENGTTYKNPTATYSHTWKRVRSMCDKALERRIRVIERALGQHCIVKMRMFAEVLILAGKDDLGKLAEEALDRLIEKVGITPEQAAKAPTG